MVEMEIAFHRIDERQSHAVARRDDGVNVRVPGYGRALPLPHDLAHYIVERELELRQGFWGSVADGALFPGMVVLAGRQKPRAADRSCALIKANGPYVLRAEVLVATLLEIVAEGLHPNPRAALRRLLEAQSAVSLGPYPMDEGAIQRICAALRMMTGAWQQVEPGGRMVVDWTLLDLTDSARQVRPHRTVRTSRGLIYSHRSPRVASRR
jgi:hypothetical protein